MRKTFYKELKELKSDILMMGSQVEDCVNKAVRSLATFDIDLAEEVIENDREIDSLNHLIEEKGTQLIATQCPVAKDLRFIHSIVYIAIHLERAGDLATNVAKMTKKIKDAPVSDLLTGVEEMGMQASKIIHLSMEAFANGDTKLARKLPLLDEPIDNNFKLFIKSLVKFAGEEKLIDAASNIILVARYLERIGDHGVDIGERVFYMITGRIEEFE
jgi:phosphate transport system protein